MNIISSVLVALLCVVSGLIGLSFNVYAQTSDAVPISDRDIATFTINNVTVVEKDTYKIITMDIDIKIQNLGSNYDFSLDKRSITLVNENGLAYYRADNCQGTGMIMIYGDKGGERTFSTCYKVDKESNKFKILFNSILLDKPSYIGNIDLTQISNGQIQTPISNPSNSSPSTSNPITSSTSQSTNIFEQLMNWLKQIFHFMILGSSFLNDS